MPKVSVIIPTYNRRALVLETIESVFCQTFRDFEVIVINDGSTDDTREALRPLADSGKIRYVGEGKRDVSAARNTGAALARGEYLAFLDDDDLWPPEKLQWQVASLEQNIGAAMVYGITKSFQGLFTPQEANQPFVPGNFPSGDCHEAFLIRNYIISLGQTLIRKVFFEKAGPFDIHMIQGVEDYEFFIRLAATGPFIYEQRPALHYRKDAGTTRLSKKRWLMYRGHCAIRAKHLGTLPTPKTGGLWFRNFVFWRECFSRGFIGVARGSFAARKSGAGFGALLVSIWLWPPMLFRVQFYRSVKSAIAGWGRGL